MTPRSELEIKGNFFTHPFAELLVEISQARIYGSLRVSNKEKKSVLYFKSGRIVFAVSNARSTRLFDKVLRRGKLTREDLVQIPNFENDFELTKFLEEKKILTKAECERLFEEQITEIITDILTWTAGEWLFSSLARIRDGLSFDIKTSQLLIDYGRCLTPDQMLSRFRTLDENFSRSDLSEIGRDLTVEEGFVLSRADEGTLSASTLVSLSAMSEVAALHSIYTLWLAGLLIRNDWQPAISQAAIAAMRDAKLELRTEAKQRDLGDYQAPPKDEKPPVQDISSPAVPQAVEATISLIDYLERVENAATYYDILGVDLKADSDELKRAYFSLAKNFHPDRYHSDGGDSLKRIQSAFTELAQAHETLKNAESREVYDYRMRKEISEREKRQASGNTGAANIQIEQAAENFDRGFSLLMDNSPETATPFLARAVHFAPKNARYHAYYGKALSYDNKQRHKAESELQAALKIDPNNATFRLILAELFIEFKLLKRAEGELTRLLAVFPSNREAQALLEKLRRSTTGG